MVSNMNSISSSLPTRGITGQNAPPAAGPPTSDGTEKWREKIPAVMYSPSVSRDGSLVASSDFWPGGKLTLQNAVSGKPTTIALPDHPASPIGIAPNNQTVAYVAADKGLTLYSLQYQKNVWQAPYKGNCILPPAYSPDGSRIAMPGDDGPVVVNVADGTTAWHQSIGQIITTSEPAWSPDGKAVAIICTSKDADLERTIDVVDAATGKPAYRAVMENLPDDQAPVVIDVHDLKTGAVVRKLKMVNDDEKGGHFHLDDEATGKTIFRGSVEVQAQNGQLTGMDYKIDDATTGVTRYKAYLRKFEGEDGPMPAYLHLLDATTGKPLAPPVDMGVGYDGMKYWREYHLSYNPQGTSIAVTRDEMGQATLSVLDAKTLTRTWESPLTDKPSHPVFNADGTRVAVTAMQWRKDPVSSLPVGEYAMEVFDANSGKSVPAGLIEPAGDSASVSAPFFTGDSVCAVDVNQKAQEAALITFPVK